MTASSCCTPARNGSGPPPAEAVGQGRDVSDIRPIPGGTALVGTDAPVLAMDGEGPLRRKRLKPFGMDATAVTNARFAAFVAATGYVSEAERLGDSFVFHALLPQGTPPLPAVPEVPWWRIAPGASWRAPFGPEGPPAPDDHPVVHVSWNDARAFAAWAGGRLPTEAEWEHAARGGLGDVPYPWGKADPTDDGPYPCNIWQGRFPDHDTGADGHAGPAPVHAYQPNGYGLFNMVGNVWEWTADRFRVRSLSKAVQAAHRGKTGYRLSKGGSFLCHASYCFRYRIAARSGLSPDSSLSHQGFRLAYDAA